MSLKQPPASPAPAGGGVPRPSAGQPCGSLARALARVYRAPKPEILVLGPLCGGSVVYLAGRGARVHVEEFRPPPPSPPRRPGEPVPDKAPVRLDQPDRRFDLVLPWETADFVPPDRLAEFGAEMRRVLREGGLLFLFSHAHPPSQREPESRYRLLADDLFLRENAGREPALRFAHPTREIERALTGFSILGIHLQRSQMREITAVKVAAG